MNAAPTPPSPAGSTAGSPPLAVTREGAVATLSLNRPDALNALDFAMMDALVEASQRLAEDDSIGVVVVRGEGRHFMAGGDIRAFAGELGHDPAERQRRFTAVVRGVHAAVETLSRMPHPLVARVQGACAGFGLSLANLCDIVVASDDAYFAAGYRQIGLSPDGGGTWSLPRVVGARRAAAILMLGERFGADEALRMGLVNRVVPLASLDGEVARVAASLADAPREAIRATRRLLRESPGHSLSQQLEAEALSFGRLAASGDFVEGVHAFIDKRPARFGRQEP